MSIEGMQAVIGAAICDAAFCRALLDCPAKAVVGFDLDLEESDTVAHIRAESLEQFAAKVEEWRLARFSNTERPKRNYFGIPYFPQLQAG